MRTIVAFLLTAVFAAAQTPAEIERLEKGIADKPNDRQAYLKALSTTEGPVEQLRATRRTLILWLIAHQPDSKLFDEPATLLWVRGRLGDPEGFDQAARLWVDMASNPAATSKTIANAALFFRATTPAKGFAILDQAGHTDPDLARARGILHATVMVGVSGIGESNNRIRMVTREAARQTPAALEARQEVDGSQDPYLIGAAGDFLTRNGQVDIPNDATFGDDDAPTLAERWLRKARSLASGDEWNGPLGNALHLRAQRTNDPAEKLRLLTESIALLPENAKAGLLPEIVNAEFQSGDDAAAERDAHSLADSPRNANEYHIGQTILGRIAMAKGEQAEGRRLLLASLNPPAKFKNPNFQPNMALAQDVYDGGDKDAVLEFLEASRALWKNDRGRIDRMISFVKKSPSADLAQLSGQFPGYGLIRQAAPAFRVTDRDGKTWTREQLRGKVAMLEFGESPAVEKIAADYAARGAILLQAEGEDIKRQFEVLTIPTVVLLDRQGNVSAVRSGDLNQDDLRKDFDAALGGIQVTASVVAPKQLESTAASGGKITLAWEPVENAESYVVEWDSRDDKGWIFDRDKTVRVIPTRETSVLIDFKGFNHVRWRVYGVPKNGPQGLTSPWRELDGLPFTKIYK